LNQPSDGTLVNPFPSNPNNQSVFQSRTDPDLRGRRYIPGLAAKRLIASGYVKPAYGRKGHLKAVWLLQEDGGNPVETHARGGTRYSFLENIETGRCWSLRRLDRRDEDGVPVVTRGVFQQVVMECRVG
jgi:hypothetical protein